ncbi:prolyl oligopeptidase family serine peptidase [Brevibacterium spongiae]|uniref:Prolyl oligopeptidase family serine peptidase n=1 Tax=Brevibacterium spongiae TaxID=2909672 RepID=A0ABY5SPC7_9MICO|nr:prolyl oligopeptidase family serine peptidase [Brevibacterium spongiae]UVI34929.1 prolyl oligopeptidase family serine peptidase [Brevibacterium spongiae]
MREEDPTLTAPTTSAELPEDENLWLEDIYGDEQIAWVKDQNARTLERFQDGLFDAIAGDLRTALDSDDRIPMVTKRGDHLYNFWRDKTNPKGLWRRTTWDSYRTAEPDWDVLLDLDELAAREDTAWVWSGAMVRRSDNRRALVLLSPDGGDSHRVREFDLDDRAFVDGGFDIPAAKTRLAWLDDDTLLVATETDADSLTTSSYPRQARVLTRGQAVTEAPIVAEVPRDHVAIFVGSDVRPGAETTDRAVIVDALDFFNSRVSYLDLDDIRTAEQTLSSDPETWAGTLTCVDVPTDVEVGFERDLMLFRPQSSWHTATTEVPAGGLAVADVAAVKNGDITPRVIFAPDAHTSLQSFTFTRDYLVLELLSDVQSKLTVLDLNNDFAESALPGVPANHMVGLGSVDKFDPATANDYWMVSTGFLTPSTLSYGTLGTVSAGAAGADSTGATSEHPDGTASIDTRESPVAEVVKTAPALFPTEGLSVEQHFATSADGTKIPYFQIAAADIILDGANPTLLDGYGGFEVSRTPGYSPVVGLGWLGRTTNGCTRRRGVYVLANIRGGGEYGPEWHTSAMRENRMRCYEDYSAVARDLIDRGVTSPQRLACAGGSNGGLLVGNMLTQYPELFGAVSCGVPLLDMARYTKLSAGYSWKAEYGDPDVPEDWEFIKNFSPYHLLEEGRIYPPVLFWTATSDDRVGPVQARKMTARMQSMGIDDVWFFEDTEGGHSAASDNEQTAFTRALSYRFLWNALTGE